MCLLCYMKIASCMCQCANHLIRAHACLIWAMIRLSVLCCQEIGVPMDAHALGDMQAAAHQALLCTRDAINQCLQNVDTAIASMPTDDDIFVGITPEHRAILEEDLRRHRLAHPSNDVAAGEEEHSNEHQHHADSEAEQELPYLSPVHTLGTPDTMLEATPSPQSPCLDPEPHGPSHSVPEKPKAKAKVSATPPKGVPKAKGSPKAKGAPKAKGKSKAVKAKAAPKAKSNAAAAKRKAEAPTDDRTRLRKKLHSVSCLHFVLDSLDSFMSYGISKTIQWFRIPSFRHFSGLRSTARLGPKPKVMGSNPVIAERLHSKSGRSI